MFKFIAGVLVGLYIAHNGDFYSYLMTQAPADAKEAAFEAVHEARQQADRLEENSRG